MLKLANSFALGSLAGGAAVSLLSCYVVRDAESWLLLVWLGYGVVGCLGGLIYAPVLKFMAFGRRELSRTDMRRTRVTAALCAVAQYLPALVARTHEYDRMLLF